MTWSKVFLYNKSFTTFSGKTSSRALLFPMEKVFEEYVAKYARRVFGERGWQVSTQDCRYHLFDVPKRFALRPDIVIRRNNTIVIMDTKWKRLAPDMANYGISQQDMYQMYAYSKKYMRQNSEAPEVWLLYPKSNVSDGIGNPEFVSDDGVKVHVYFVDVERIEESLEHLNGMIVYS